MACFHPIRGYRSRNYGSKLQHVSGPKKGPCAVYKKVSTGNFYFTLKASEAFVDLPMEVPCGRCIGCRIQRSKEWAIRCVHEASLYKENCFITLTFNEKYYKDSLVKRDFQLFMKRLRKRFSDVKIRYFHCGEYGQICANCGLSQKMCFRRGCQEFKSMIGRPHHHACLFNIDFPDKVLWKVERGIKLFRSPILEQLWADPVSGESYGFSTVGEVTFESAAYVARYILKKFTNKDSKKVDEHYAGRIPEYTTMSRRGGIGKGWYEKFKSDVYPDDFVLTKKMEKLKPPRYYDNIYKIESPQEMERIKAIRLKKHNERPITALELRRREEILERRLKRLKRNGVEK